MAHLFEAYAVANLMMCSAVATGTMHSRSTGMMRGSCARHLRATIGILQPTLVISEGAGLDEPLCAALGVTKPMSKTLPRCDLDGNQFVWASLQHPAGERALAQTPVQRDGHAGPPRTSAGDDRFSAAATMQEIRGAP
jgi:hypothetical protein